MSLLLNGERRFEGAVLDARVRNNPNPFASGNWAIPGQLFEVLVWDAVKRQPYCFSQEADRDPFQATIDATSAVRWSARDWAYNRAYEAVWRDWERERMSIQPGAEVSVVRGRKVPKGTRGVVKRQHFGKFGLSVQLLTEAGELLWVSADNCSVVTPAMMTEEEAENKALDILATGRYTHL